MLERGSLVTGYYLLTGKIPQGDGWTTLFYKASWSSPGAGTDPPITSSISSIDMGDNSYDVSYFLQSGKFGNINVPEVSIYESFEFLVNLYAPDEARASWWDYTTTSFDLVASGVETTIGGLTSETGAGAYAAVDGGGRVIGNINKLVEMANTGTKAESVPTNDLAMIGNFIDQETGNIQRQWQAGLGSINDITSFFINPKSGYKSLDEIKEWIDKPNDALGIYDDYKSDKQAFFK